LQLAPGAEPTADDAKKVKASMASAERLRGLVRELRDLHEKNGTELTGPVATRMGQLMTAIRLEGKNIAELGALSGPDMGLMESLSGSDPSSLSANLKATFGVDNTKSSLDGLEGWANSQLAANEKAYGYQPSPGAQRPDIDLTKPPTGERKQYSPSRNKTRVLDAQGNVLRVEDGDTRGR
jgi:hypothetical protein